MINDAIQGEILCNSLLKKVFDQAKSKVTSKRECHLNLISMFINKYQ